MVFSNPIKRPLNKGNLVSWQTCGWLGLNKNPQSESAKTGLTKFIYPTKNPNNTIPPRPPPSIRVLFLSNFRVLRFAPFSTLVLQWSIFRYPINQSTMVSTKKTVTLSLSHSTFIQIHEMLLVSNFQYCYSEFDICVLYIYVCMFTNAEEDSWEY